MKHEIFREATTVPFDGPVVSVRRLAVCDTAGRLPALRRRSVAAIPLVERRVGRGRYERFWISTI